MRIAFTRLRYMRLKDSASCEISSEPLIASSGTLRSPLLIWSAAFDKRVTGRITIVTIARSSNSSVANAIPQGEHQAAKSAVGNPERDRHGNGNNLCADRIPHLPIKSVVPAINPDHGRRRILPGIVATKTGPHCHDGLGQEQRSPSRRIALSGKLLLLRMPAEDLNEVSLPIDSAVPQVCGIERRFLVGIFGIISTQIVEGLS